MINTITRFDSVKPGPKIIRSVSFLILITILFLFSYGCEGYRCAGGVISDSMTHKPLDSVLCKVVTGSNKVYSDSTGKYEVCNNFGGCVPKCPDIEVEFSKTGYLTKIIKNPNKDNIYLDKD
jgi:hypothetical protein